MSRRSPFATTYVAVAVLAALGAYIYFVERERDPDAGERLFAELDVKAVHAVAIEPQAGETIRLERDGQEAWRLAAPIQVEADATAVDGLLRGVEELELDETLEGTGGRLADFGLETPRFELRLLGEDGAPLVSLALGDETPGGSAVYARAAGREDVVTVGTSVESELDKEPFDFRVRDVLRVDRDAIETLEVAGPEGDFTLEKRGEDAWAFTQPLRTQAGRWAVDSLVGLIANLKMESVAAEQAEELAEFGLDPPQRRVTVGLEGGAFKTLEIGSSPEEGKHYARAASSKLVAVIPGTLVEDLAEGMSGLRAERLLDVSTFDVDGITAELPGGRKVWTRSGGEGEEDDATGPQQWRRTEPEEAEVETSEVEDALYELTGLDVKGFIDAPQEDAAYGLDEPAARIVLRRGDEPEVEVVLGRTGDAAYGRRPGDDAVLELDAEPVDEVLKSLEEL